MLSTFVVLVCCDSTLVVISDLFFLGGLGLELMPDVAVLVVRSILVLLFVVLVFINSILGSFDLGFTNSSLLFAFTVIGFIYGTVSFVTKTSDFLAVSVFLLPY